MKILCDREKLASAFQTAALVRALVGQREQLALDVKHENGATFDLETATLAGLKLASFGNDMSRHVRASRACRRPGR